RIGADLRRVDVDHVAGWIAEILQAERVRSALAVDGQGADHAVHGAGGRFDGAAVGIDGDAVAACAGIDPDTCARGGVLDGDAVAAGAAVDGQALDRGVVDRRGAVPSHGGGRDDVGVRVRVPLVVHVQGIAGGRRVAVDEQLAKDVIQRVREVTDIDGVVV